MGTVFQLSLLGAALLGGCAPRPIQFTVGEGSSARAISLLGDTLWTAPVDPRQGPQLVTQLQIARALVSADPTDLNAQLTLALRTAAVGQLREAVDMLTRTATIHYLSARVLRHRGEILLDLRELDQAYEDFEEAQNLIGMRGRPAGPGRMGSPPGRLPEPREVRSGEMDTTSGGWRMMLESADGTDATGPVITSVEFQISRYMGVIRYLQGDLAGARDHLLEAARRASSDDDLAAASLWLFFATRRAGNIQEATDILAAVQAGWAVQARRHELQMLLAYKGQVPTDTIEARAMARLGGDERALYCYGIGYMLLVTGRTDEAVLWLEQARKIPNWTALPYLAAEADLAWLRGSRRKGG